ncbi:MAG: cysteine protease [Cirrosporium novae-zelandiae]|nr:MAG: cysteine protease [Cirrosporium novae-zelandiae]
MDYLEPGLESLALHAESRLLDPKSKEEALKSAIEAIELYMRILPIVSNKEERKCFDKKCLDLLQYAETLKKTRGPSKVNPFPLPPTRREHGHAIISRSQSPASCRQLATREKIILLESSKLNGFIFPPWKEDPMPDEFALKHEESPFLDVPDLPLSSLQQRVFLAWKRPNELLDQKSKVSASGEAGTVKIYPEMSSQVPIDLVQDITSDCSVIASLCSSIARERRGHPKILTTVFFPYDRHNQRPSFSPNGKYIFKLYFNGCFRKVTIDDRLPASKTSRSIHVVDRNNPGVLWPALLEKAYLKVRGGYDFPGSNSGTDISMLTGWIPEQLFLHDEDLESNALWDRIVKSFASGDVLLTLGTGKISTEEETHLGLVPDHDYAVLDVCIVHGQPRALIKNPWANATRQNGGRTQNNKRFNTFTKDLEESLPSDEPRISGTFWVTSFEIFQHFEYLYLNWNPKLFSYCENVHFTWDLTDIMVVRSSFNDNPQYAISSTTGGTVWLLLNRHFKTNEGRSSPFGGHPSQETGFISLYAFQRHGQRVFLSDNAMRRGHFVDSPNTLLIMDLKPAEKYTIVIAQDFLPPLSYNFTLTAFSINPISMGPAQQKYSHYNKHSSEWTCHSAGGNAESPTYSNNPQYYLKLHAKTRLALLLETPDSDLAVHVNLLGAAGHRVSKVTMGLVLGNSGEYRRGCALAEFDAVNPGSYTIICSTFESQQLGKFCLKVYSMSDCMLVPLPAEAAGKLLLEAPLAIFPPKCDRLVAPLHAKRLTRCKIVIHPYFQRAAPSSIIRSPVKASIELGKGFYKRVLTVTGHDTYQDAKAGVRTEEVDIVPEMAENGGAWVALERLKGYDDQNEEAFEVKILSETRISLGKWTTDDL